MGSFSAWYGDPLLGNGQVVEGSQLVMGEKMFGQPHPGDPSKMMRFVCLEGNESGTYFRGSSHIVDGAAVIDVPEEFRLATEAEGLTVQLTAVGARADLWIESQDLDRIVVRADADVEFHYFANGVRRGFADFEPIAENSVFVPTVRDVPYGLHLNPEMREMMVSSGLLNEDLTPNEATIEAMGRTLRDSDPERPGVYDGNVESYLEIHAETLRERASRR